MRKCSTTGPSTSAGTKVSAPTSSTVPTSRLVKSGPETGNVPALSAINFLRPSEPASARIGTMMTKRPKSVASPTVASYQGAFAVRPATALPLLRWQKHRRKGFAKAVGTAIVCPSVRRRLRPAHLLTRPARETGWRKPESG